MNSRGAFMRPLNQLLALVGNGVYWVCAGVHASGGGGGDVKILMLLCQNHNFNL